MAPRPQEDPGTFLSTLPARGATPSCLLWLKALMNFYPRSPRGERHIVEDYFIGTRYISIHAPREGSDQKTSRVSLRWPLFLSTLPARGATAHPSGAHRGRSISIHAPREGSDRPPIHQTEDQNISIHAPREGSDSSYRPSQQSMHTFLSTLPARGATLFYGIDSLQHYISIHAPREGSDAR